MGHVIMTAAVSLDGFIADDADQVGPLFDWYGNGDVAWRFVEGGVELRTTQASADFMRRQTETVAALIIGRRLFDMTDGWSGQPAAGEHVFVVTHVAPTDWTYADSAPFTFVTDGVEAAIQQAREFAGDRDVTITAGDIGGQALRAGSVDRVVLNLVPAVLGTGRPFFGTGAVAGPILFDNPTETVQGDRVTHLVYDLQQA